MQYKALMLDVDGTVVPYDYEALPSNKLSEAVKKAQKKIIICFVTGRSYPFLKPILKKLDIHKGFAVVNNGSHVINLATEKTLYEQQMNVKDTEETIEILHRENITFYITQHLHETDYYVKPFKKGVLVKTAYMFFTDETYSSEKTDEVSKKLSHLSNLTVYKTRHKSGFGLNIQHVNATKLRGVETILKKLNLPSDEIIGVGDSYNDFPLLMACGLKVAMGNAVEDLKAIADYIAPDVEHDGVADVIEKFVLNSA